MASHFLSHLKERELVAQVSHEDELAELLAKGPFDDGGKRYAVYCGFDPTARSLHVGNLVGIMGLRRAQDMGLTPIVVFGGATGLVGDPTGRTEMRQMHSKDQIAEFIENFKRLVGRYFRHDVPNPPVYVNNADWMKGMSWLDFLRDVGVHFTIARLLAAEVNRTRFEAGGLTFMELGYQLLQAYDFLHLSREHNCIIQVGGNDQWSNILAGADLIRRVDAKKAFAVTFPLLVGSDGRKYGKSAGNATWLDPSMTSPYEFFQFFRNVPDADIALLRRIFSFDPMDAISLQASGAVGINVNEVKERMALDITALVHGHGEAENALSAARALFSGGGDLSGAPSSTVAPADVDAGLGFVQLLVKVGLCPSNGEARKLIQGNGLTVNGERLVDATAKVTMEHFETEQGALVLRKGKKEYHLVRLAGG